MPSALAQGRSGPGRRWAPSVATASRRSAQPSSPRCAAASAIRRSFHHGGAPSGMVFWAARASASLLGGRSRAPSVDSFPRGIAADRRRSARPGRPPRRRAPRPPRPRRRGARPRLGPPPHLLAQGLPPPHQPVQEPLRLLLVPPLPGRSGRVDDEPGGGGRLARPRPARGVRGGALLPRATSPSPRSAPTGTSCAASARRARWATSTTPAGSRSTHGLLPHTNAGILTAEDMARLKEVNVSLGLMLENISPRLCQPGMPHHRAPDKRPERRMKMIEEAGAPPHPVHHRHPGGHRRDAARAGGEPARHPARAPRARPHPGGDRAELPAAARHRHGRRARADARRPRPRRRDGAARARRAR